MRTACKRGIQTDDPGISVLIVYGAEIYPPKVSEDGSVSAGIRVTADADGTCTLQAVGYADGPTAQTAIARAAQACVDAGLRVDNKGPVGGLPARVVQRQ